MLGSILRTQKQVMSSEILHVAELADSFVRSIVFGPISGALHTNELVWSLVYSKLFGLNNNKLLRMSTVINTNSAATVMHSRSIMGQ